MSRIYLLEGLLLNLEQKIQAGRREYLDRSAAYERLKAITGQDFGYDSQQWRNWIKHHKALLRAQGKPSR
jgi:hypothetical protein